MSDTPQEEQPVELTEEQMMQQIGDLLRASNQSMSMVANFGYPVPAINLYLEGKEEGTILTSEAGNTQQNASMVIASPVLSLIAYSMEQEKQGVMIDPAQKDVMREEAMLLDQLLDQAKKILANRLAWLGPKEEKKLIVQTR